MKLTRSAKMTLKFSTKSKQEKLKLFMGEYSRVVNEYINLLWEQSLTRNDLIASFYSQVDTWLGGRCKSVAAREALDMVNTVKAHPKNNKVKPTHHGKRACLSGSVCNLKKAKTATGFDYWLEFRSIGNKFKLDIPVKGHKHFNQLKEQGTLNNYYILTDKEVQVSFKIVTEKKKLQGECRGVDSGVKSLATLDNGEKYGQEIEFYITEINKCKWGSKEQKRRRKHLKQYINKVVKEITTKPGLRLIVVERLYSLNKGTKKRKRLNRKMRRVLGTWIYRYWLDRLQMGCESNRVTFRTVPSYYTSQRCHVCSHTEKGNRLSQSVFLCRKCGYAGDADINAARNILDRFLTGSYSTGFQGNL